MIFMFAIVGAVVAFLPAASFFLIPLELFLIHRIADRYGQFELAPFLAMAAALFTFSAFLKGAASLLHWIPLLGQLANSGIAFVFILIVGNLAESYYQGKARG